MFTLQKVSKPRMLPSCLRIAKVFLLSGSKQGATDFLLCISRESPSFSFPRLWNVQPLVWEVFPTASHGVDPRTDAVAM